MCLTPLLSLAVQWNLRAAELANLPIDEMVRELESQALLAQTEIGTALIMPYVNLLLALVALLPTQLSNGLRTHLATEIAKVDDLETNIEIVEDAIAALGENDERNAEALSLLSRSLSAVRWPYWHRLIERRVQESA